MTKLHANPDPHPPLRGTLSRWERGSSHGSLPKRCHCGSRSIPTPRYIPRSKRLRSSPRKHGRARTRWSKSCAPGWAASDPCARVNSRTRSAFPRATSRLHSPRWNARAARCAAASPRARNRIRHGDVPTDRRLWPPIRQTWRGLAAAVCGTLDASPRDEEWCDRHLLARIHRRTLQRLRREIEPVAPRDFLRFLIDWQHVSPDTRLRGPDALAAVLAQLEGFEAPAGAWESQLLPARVAGYDIAWLDALCAAGRIAWTRLRASAGGAHASPVRASPIVLLPRKQLSTWNAIGAHAAAEPPALSSRAQAVVEFLAQHGASFFGEIADGTRLLKVELEDALGELVGAGLVGADSFAGLRALLQPASKRKHPRQRRLARHLLSGIEDAGRWSLIHALHPSPIGSVGSDPVNVAMKP